MSIISESVQFEHAGIANLKPDAPITVNEHGGKASSIPFRFDLLSGIAAKAMLKIAGLMAHRVKKLGENNWHNVTPQEHLNHALTHAFAWLAGDTQDDHVSHFHCRALMFAATLEDPKWKLPYPLRSNTCLDRDGQYAENQEPCGKKSSVDRIISQVEDSFPFKGCGVIPDHPGINDCTQKKESYGEMLNRHHKENAEFNSIQVANEKDFFDSLYP